MKTREQLKALEEAFSECAFVCGEELAHLADATGLTTDQVKKWFEHQRRKLRLEYQARNEPVPVWLEARTADMPTRKPVASAAFSAASAAPVAPKPKRAPRKKAAAAAVSEASAAEVSKPNIKSKIQKIKSSVLAPEQLAELNAALDEFTCQRTRLPEEPRPSATVLASLVEATGLDEDLVALWFERKVERMRRLAEQQAEIGEDVETFKTGQKHLTAEQRGILEGAFLMATYPTQETIAMLSRKTDIPVTRICNWFNQRRAKARRMSELGDERPTRPDRFPPATLAALEAAFAEKPYLDHDEKIEMAERLGLEVKQIKIYWTSARARCRQQGVHLEPPAMWCSSRARRLASKRSFSDVDESVANSSSTDNDDDDEEVEVESMETDQPSMEEAEEPPLKRARRVAPPRLEFSVGAPQLTTWSSAASGAAAAAPIVFPTLPMLPPPALPSAFTFALASPQFGAFSVDGTPCGVIGGGAGAMIGTFQSAMVHSFCEQTAATATPSSSSSSQLILVPQQSALFVDGDDGSGMGGLCESELSEGEFAAFLMPDQ